MPDDDAPVPPENANPNSDDTPIAVEPDDVWKKVPTRPDDETAEQPTIAVDNAFDASIDPQASTEVFARPNLLDDALRLPRQEARPRRWYTKAWYSLICYIVVMLLLASILGWSIFALHQSPATFEYAFGVSMFFGCFIVLRIARGSALTAQEKTREYLRQRICRVNDPDAVLFGTEYWVSDRVAEEIDLNTEPVLMEMRLHPISILPALVTNVRNRVVYVSALLYGAIAIAVSAVNSGGFVWMLLGIPVGIAAYVWLTIADWYRCYYAVTANRLMKVHGLIGTDAPSMLRSQITDVAVTIPWYAKILQWLRITDVAFGTWDIESTGQDQRIKYVRYMRCARELAVVIGLGQRSPS